MRGRYPPSVRGRRLTSGDGRATIDNKERCARKPLGRSGTKHRPRAEHIGSPGGVFTDRVRSRDFLLAGSAPAAKPATTHAFNAAAFCPLLSLSSSFEGRWVL